MEHDGPITELRKLAVMTQEELADSLGVSREIVQCWEYGEHFPRPKNLRALAELFEMPPRDLYLSVLAWRLAMKQEATE